MAGRLEGDCGSQFRREFRPCTGRSYPPVKPLDTTPVHSWNHKGMIRTWPMAMPGRPKLEHTQLLPRVPPSRCT
jgi:hypothetical protein